MSTFRVLCPDGSIFDEYHGFTEREEETALGWAMNAADTCDRIHDRCNDLYPGHKHRVRRSLGWVDVPR